MTSQNTTFVRMDLGPFFSIGYKKWRTLQKSTKIPTLQPHGNNGKTNWSFTYKSEVLEFLAVIAHTEGESQATGFVQELTGIGVRNEEKFGVALPPYRTKRKKS